MAGKQSMLDRALGVLCGVPRGLPWGVHMDFDAARSPNSGRKNVKRSNCPWCSPLDWILYSVPVSASDDRGRMKPCCC